MLQSSMTRWVGLLALVAMSGCYGTRSLQMNSDSQAAQLGWNIPIKARADQRIQPVSAEREDELVEVTVEEAPEEPSRWKRWFGGGTSAKALPLPRTDLREDGTTVEHHAPDQAGLTDF